MKQNLAALFFGMVFAVGLTVSGLTNPNKVQNFLDIAGDWDPSLIFVMVGAIAVSFLPFKFYKKIKNPYLSREWHVPKIGKPDKKLVIGSIAFGIGWGLAGFCPGPAIATMGFGKPQVWIFVTAMLAGMGIFTLKERSAGR